MSFSRLLRLSLLFLFAIAAEAEPALKSGEAFTFRVGWGVFMHAGEIRIAAIDMPTAEGEPRLQVVTTTATRGVAKAIYPFEARAESFYDGKTGRLLVTTEVTKNDTKETKVTTQFDYTKSTASYVSSKNPAPVMLIMPAGEPQDLIMSLVQTRRWTLKPGEHQDALVIFGDEFYELTIYAERYEEVRTPVGTFNALVLVPKMEKTPPKGMFKRGGAVRVWISQDERHLPVKFQVDFKFGAGVATLTAYIPPRNGTNSPAPAANAKNSRP
jgi:hypothetical protein